MVAAFTNLIALNVNIVSLLCIETSLWSPTIIFCQIRTYIMNVSLQISRFLILFACFDRYALCSTNAYLRKFCHIRVARRYVIPSIIIIWCIIPLHIPLHVFVVENDCVFDGTIAFYNGIYSIIFIGTFPPILMFIFSLLIFRNLKLRQRRRQIHPFIINSTNPIKNNENRRLKLKDEQVLGMLLVQVFAYVISTTPYTIIRFYIVLQMNNSDDPSTSHEMMIIFVSFITDMLRFFCPFTSFYLFISVSHLYRRETKLFLLNIYHKFKKLWSNNNNFTHASNSIRLNERRQQQRTTDISRNVIPSQMV